MIQCVLLKYFLGIINLKYIKIGFILVFLYSNLIYSQDKSFTMKQFKSDNESINYMFWVPHNYSKSKKYPLILMLHGAGTRGTSNGENLKYFKDLIKYSQNNHPAFMVAPIVPVERVWATYGWGTKNEHMTNRPSFMMSMTNKLLNKLIHKHSINSKRIYITGVSIGGYGTWEFIQRYPEMIAAAIPVCGGGDVKFANKLITTPIWGFHGNKDDVIPSEKTAKMIKAINKAGGIARYSELSNVGHNAWDFTYNKSELMKWLFKH